MLQSQTVYTSAHHFCAVYPYRHGNTKSGHPTVMKRLQKALHSQCVQLLHAKKCTTQLSLKTILIFSLVSVQL